MSLTEIEQARLAGVSLAGVPAGLIEADSPSNGREPARRVAMLTFQVAGSRR